MFRLFLLSLLICVSAAFYADAKPADQQIFSHTFYAGSDANVQGFGGGLIEITESADEHFFQDISSIAAFSITHLTGRDGYTFFYIAPIKTIDVVILKIFLRYCNLKLSSLAA